MKSEQKEKEELDSTPDIDSNLVLLIIGLFLAILAIVLVLHYQKIESEKTKILEGFKVECYKYDPSYVDFQKLEGCFEQYAGYMVCRLDNGTLVNVPCTKQILIRNLNDSL